MFVQNKVSYLSSTGQIFAKGKVSILFLFPTPTIAGSSGQTLWWWWWWLFCWIWWWCFCRRHCWRWEGGGSDWVTPCMIHTSISCLRALPCTLCNVHWKQSTPHSAQFSWDLTVHGVQWCALFKTATRQLTTSNLRINQESSEANPIFAAIEIRWWLVHKYCGLSGSPVSPAL